MTKLFANSGSPDHTPRSAASNLGLHCAEAQDNTLYVYICMCTLWMNVYSIWHLKILA